MSHNLFWDNIERREKVHIAAPIMYTLILALIPVVGWFMIPMVWGSYSKANHLINYDGP